EAFWPRDASAPDQHMGLIDCLAHRESAVIDRSPESKQTKWPTAPRVGIHGLETPRPKIWLRLTGIGAAALAVVLLRHWWLGLPEDNRSPAIWTIVISSLACVPCAVLGCFLVLRRQSLLGDTICHAVLPGIALAFFLNGQLSGLNVILSS